MTDSLNGRVVLVAGASSESGIAVSAALDAAGARVVAVGSRRTGLDALLVRVPGVETRVCDLADRDAVRELGSAVRLEFGHVDGLIHLVGGWRGGGGLDGQSDEDWAFLERAFATLRNTSREFYDDLLFSGAGRLAIVSSTTVEHPLAGSANYAAAKAAGDAWTRAVAQGFRKAASNAAAVVFVVNALNGLETELGNRVVALWAADAAAINGTRIPLVG